MLYCHCLHDACTRLRTKEMTTCLHTPTLVYAPTQCYTSTIHVLLQFTVDISTPASVIDTISHAMRAHIEANSTEYKSGSATVSFSSNGDPLKVQLVAAFDFSHNGKPS